MKRVTYVSIINGLILLLLTLLDFAGGIHFNMFLSYQWHKVLHLTGVVLFMGNMIVGPIWFSMAWYSKDWNLIRFSSRVLQLTDMYCTIPGVALTVINGLFLASVYGGTTMVPWLFWSIIWLLATWAMSVPVMYLQEKMYRLLDSDQPNEQAVKTIMNWWGWIGTLLVLPPSVIFYLMVVKPA